MKAGQMITGLGQAVPSAGRQRVGRSRLCPSLPPCPPPHSRFARSRMPSRDKSGTNRGDTSKNNVDLRRADNKRQN